MEYSQRFLAKWQEKNSSLGEEVGKSAIKFVEQLESSFDYKSCFKALLLGHVQSGKTSQMLAAIACLADRDFKLFILLTSDDNKLYQQTYERTLDLEEGFCICGENDELRFKVNDLSRPAILILKKNASILKTWNGILTDMPCCRALPGVIFDDEADAASLNTKVNQKDISTINRLLDKLEKIPSSSIYVQVTATPQAILLQTVHSGWKPQVVHMFVPGKGYCGGKHFYVEDSRYTKQVSEDEKSILLNEEEIPPGLRDALLCFLLNAIFLIEYQGRKTCNFLIHPGVKTADHAVAEQKMKKLLEAVKNEASTGSAFLRLSFLTVYEDLVKSYQGMPPFEYFWSRLPYTVEKVCRQILNSKEPIGINYKIGANILIGGNGTGRGITFPALQVVYYCRESKTPLADTLWQHSRIFGYDRHLPTCRMFLPPQLQRVFQRLHAENEAMFALLADGMPSQPILYKLEGTQPSRKNVLSQEALSITLGGVDYFIGGVSHKNTDQLDVRVGVRDREQEITIRQALDFLSLIDPESNNDALELQHYKNCFSSIEAAESDKCHLIVRVDRDISKNSGTLLSPNDRLLGAAIIDKPVLTLYRVVGHESKGWDGKSVWVPNVKFPKGRLFYGMQEASC